MTLLTSRAGMPGQHFFLNYSNTPSETQLKIMALALSF